MAHGVGFGARPHELGEGIESRFRHGDLLRPRRDSPWLEVWVPAGVPLETKVVLDWRRAGRSSAFELMTNHNLAKREKQNWNCLRRPADLFPLRHQGNSHDVFRAEIERINARVDETKERWRTRQIEAPPTDVSLRWVTPRRNSQASRRAGLIARSYFRSDSIDSMSDASGQLSPR